MSFRSRAVSCATDNTSEDALSIRSEMIQRKGTQPGGCRAGGCEPRGRNGGWGAWEESWTLSWCGHEPGQGFGGALGEKRATPAESERWGWAGGTEGRTDTVSSPLRLRSDLAAAGASPGSAKRLACPLAVGGAGDTGDALARASLMPGPTHAFHRFHLPTARLLSQILGQGQQEEEGEEDNSAGHPPACPEGAG